MDIEARNKEIREAFHAAGIRGQGIVFDVLDSGAVAVDTMRPVNMTPGVTGDKADHGTKVAWLLHEACPEAEIRSYYCLTGKHINTALANVLEHARAEPDRQHVVNISMTGTSTKAVTEEQERLIGELTALNVPVVCAAGNDGEEKLNRYPSCFQDPYTASAIDKTGAKCVFSTWHNEVDFAEHGRSVTTRRADKATIRQSGTSFSSPILAGKIALLHCEAMQRGERLTDARLYEKLKAAAADLGETGRDPYFGWGYVDVAPQAAEREPAPGATAWGLCSWCVSQIRQVYVWGGNGEEATPAKIKAMETSTANYQRALALYNKRRAEGMNPILMYDCSGLISRYLQNHGIVEKKRNCNHLASMCAFVKERDNTALLPGDLLFRWSSASKFYHVGVYVGDGCVIESRGRDDGVVIRKINASGASHWNRWGRLACLSEGKEEPNVAKVLMVKSPMMRGEDVKALQAALNALGYPCGDADGVCGQKTMAGVMAFCEAHLMQTELPEALAVVVNVAGKEYRGEIGG